MLARHLAHRFCCLWMSPLGCVTHFLACLFAAGVATVVQTPAQAQANFSSAPARSHMAVVSGAPTPPTPLLLDDVALADYMQALTRVNPAAAEGAAAFMRAFLARCGRPMRTIELRQAAADGAGDPVLMQMIRAAYEHDENTSSRLAGQVDCARYGVGQHDHGGGR